MKAVTISLVILSMSLLPHIMYGQRIERQLQEEADRTQRQQDGLKHMEERDAQGNVIWIKDYNRKGQLTYSLHRHKPTANYGHDLYPGGMASNIWRFAYDQSGNLLSLINDHDFVSGTAHGEGEPFALPYIGPPFSYDTIHQELDMKYVYDNDGRKTELTGYYIDPGIFFNQTKTLANITGGPKSKFKYSYDKAGRLVEEQEKRLNIDKVPLYRRVYLYDKNGNLLNESEYSGDKQTKEFKYTYNQLIQLIEKQSDSRRITYSYDESGNMVELKKYYTLNGNLVHQRNFAYDGHGTLISQKFSIQIENQSQHNATYVCQYDEKGHLTTKLYAAPDGTVGKAGFYYSYYD